MEQFQGNDVSKPPQYQSSGGSFNDMNKVYDDCKPMISLIFLLFKVGPILIYLLLKLVTNQYLSTFIVIVLLLSFDFWVTKNIAGRELVALRWYTKIGEANIQKWCFESSKVRVASACNSLVFWLGNFIPILFWLVITLINIITLSAFWVFLAIFCAVLLICNFVFFLECKGDHQKKVNALTKKLGVQFFELNQEKQ